MTNTQVEVIKHKDVRGNELLYLRIVNGQNHVLINIGQKTFDGVNELLNPKQKEQPKKEENKK